MTDGRKDRPVDRPASTPRPLSRAGIDVQNRYLLRRYREFRLAADRVTAAWKRHPHVVAISLIGSLARDPWKEVPRFQPWRRAGVELWHECKDIDLALWLDDLADLNGLRRMRAKALRDMLKRGGLGVASHQLDGFVFEPGTDLYLGRLCDFNACPKGKRECRVPGCGKVAFLRQHEDFVWQREALAGDRALRLFDRASGTVRLAADLPLPGDDRSEPVS